LSGAIEFAETPQKIATEEIKTLIVILTDYLSVAPVEENAI